jgi:hypothetical protein
LLEHWLTARTTVIEEHIQQRECVYMPRGEDVLYLLLGVRLSFFAPFELHPLDCEGDFFFREVEGLRDLRDVGEDEVAC